MKGIGVLILLLMFSLALEGCYTVVYTDVVYQDNYYPPPPPPPPPRPPHPNPPYYPPQPIIIVPAPVKPPPPKYITRPPGNKQRDPGVVDPKRNGGGRGNDGGRR